MIENRVTEHGFESQPCSVNLGEFTHLLNKVIGLHHLKRCSPKCYEPMISNRKMKKLDYFPLVP